LKEIALHILDIAENGITAGAGCIRICIDEARSENRLKIVVQDDGNGIAPEKLPQITDPFITTRSTRRVGLGLSLLETAARRCDGAMAIECEPEKGTRVTATFRYDHIDRAPVGDMVGSIITLIAGNPDVEFVYTHIVDGKKFILDTREIQRELGDLSLTEPIVIRQLAQSIKKSLDRLEQKDGKRRSREK